MRRGTRDQAPGGALQPPIAPDRPGSYHVLLLESDPSLARDLRAHLEAGGLRVTWVADGPGGLCEALRARHDAVVLELALPGLTGLELCRRLRSWVGVPVLVLAARAGEGDRQRALRAGADAFLAKPASPHELLACLRTLARGARLLTLDPGRGSP